MLYKVWSQGRIQGVIGDEHILQEELEFRTVFFHGPNIDNFKDVYKLLKSFKISKEINTTKELASLITFKKNKDMGIKIKNIGEIILKKTIKELDNLIKNEFKKT